MRLIVFVLMYFLPLIAFAQLNTLRPDGQKVNTTRMDEGKDSAIISTALPEGEYNAEEIKLLDSAMKNEPALYYLPLKKIIPGSGFGDRLHPLLGVVKQHNGVDLKATYEPVYAIANGTVKEAGYAFKEGNYIVVEHSNIESVYCHLSTLIIKKGDKIKGGSCIAISGSTGWSTGPHLHFGLKVGGKAVDPEIFLRNIYALNNAIETTTISQ